MRLYLIRHGAYQSDYTSERGPGLSTIGEAQARCAGTFLKAQRANPSVILTSGYRRAQETAALIAETLQVDYVPVESPDFSPSGDPYTMRAIIEALDVNEVMVVGHMCSIGELARSLSLQAPALFDTCTVMAFERIGAQWKFLWFNDCGRSIS